MNQRKQVVRNGAMPEQVPEGIRNALTFLESLGYKSGDIHDDLESALSEVEATVAAYQYVSEDIMDVADDIGVKLTDQQAEDFLLRHGEWQGTLQAAGYESIRGTIEERLQREYGVSQ